MATPSSSVPVSATKQQVITQGHESVTDAERSPGAWYPENDILAVIDSSEEAERAVTELAEAGFHPEDVLLATGVDIADRIDATGLHCSLLRHLLRWYDNFMTGESGTARAHGPQNVIAIHTHEAADITRAREILERNHAHNVEHFGHWTVERLSP